ncbi:jg10821 [Pararge aegeria aegeria]|uniref:Jg10821 protein n=1 Tax=Pararge aegeria aegeria TaxID=348720 RepID=A0A8S4QH21_9NEOP|nr:jg10821 [Pararge aegeria aegeria]
MCKELKTPRSLPNVVKHRKSFGQDSMERSSLSSVPTIDVHWTGHRPVLGSSKIHGPGVEKESLGAARNNRLFLAAPSDSFDVVGPPRWVPTNTAFTSAGSPFQHLETPAPIGSPSYLPRSFSLQLCIPMSVTLVLLQIFSFLISSRRDTPNIAPSPAK